MADRAMPEGAVIANQIHVARSGVTLSIYGPPGSAPIETHPCDAPAPRADAFKARTGREPTADSNDAREGRKVIRTTCEGCGAPFGRAGRAHRTYCGNTCRGRAAKARKAGG